MHFFLSWSGEHPWAGGEQHVSSRIHGWITLEKGHRYNTACNLMPLADYQASDTELSV